MNTLLLELEIDGMSCDSCVSHVRKALAKLPGLRVDDVWAGGARIAAPASVPEDVIGVVIADAIAGAGYTLRSARRPQAGASTHAPTAPRADAGCCCSSSGHQPSPGAAQLTRRRAR